MPKLMHHQATQATGKAVAQHKLARLRHMVARFEPTAAEGPQCDTGFAPIDDYLHNQGGGGLPCGGMHEVIAARSGDMAATLGFAHALAARFLAQQTTQTMLLYGQTHAAAREAGQPYAPAMAAHGLSAEQLVYLDGVALPDLLWAGEEALTCPAIGCSILASWDDAPDFTVSRRLSLAARAAGRPLIVALAAPASGQSSAATTRWHITAQAGQAWQVKLSKSRLNYTSMPPPEGWTIYPHHKSKPKSKPTPQAFEQDLLADLSPKLPSPVPPRTARTGS